jgi:hypothetical protein
MRGILPSLFLGELPADLSEEFEQNRIDRFKLVPTTEPTPAVATGAAAEVVEVDTQEEAHDQPLVQPEVPKEHVQEPEVQVEAEVPSEAGGPTEPEPQPLEVPSQAQSRQLRNQLSCRSLRCKLRHPRSLLSYQVR